MNQNDLNTQQQLNELANDSQAKLIQEKIKKTREKELDKEIFNASPILRNSPFPVDIYKEENNIALKSLFFIDEKNKKIVYLTEKEFITIDPKTSHDSASASFYWQEQEFRERTNQNEKMRKRIESICVKNFVRNLEKKYLAEKLCEKIDHQSGNIKDFKELKIEDPKLFFDNLFKYVDKFGDAKDILIIADRKTYRFIKQNETGKFLEDYIGNLLENNLKNYTKLIITSQKGLLIPYSVKLSDYDNTHYLRINYKIELMDSNPITIFKEENTDKSSI